jgi:predicted nuclease of restriction endonuclease-like RecB superfamily
MLTGNLVRLKFHRDRVSPQFLDVDESEWLIAAADLIDLFRESVSRTRSEVAADVLEIVGESNASLIQQGLAKLLDDRCEYETVADRPPEDVRESAFRHSAIHRAAMAASGAKFDRNVVVQSVSAELSVPPEQVETLLFADLKDEQRVLKFDDITPEQLLHRYNVALVQSILLKSVGVEIRVRGESPARLRQLFRAIRFRRLIAIIREETNNSYLIRIDGPLSLFSATQKYGLQLALFLPTLLHCQSFELNADLRWGAERREKKFSVSSDAGLKSHTADFGVFTPKEFELFAASFRSTIHDWRLSDDPAPISLSGGIWVPDFAITHTPTGQVIHLELFGYWRRVDLQKHYERLHSQIPGKFLIVVSEQLRADDEDDMIPPGVVHYKRTPSAEAVAMAASQLLPSPPWG